MQWMFLPFKRYVDFQGRSCRMEYWMFHLFIAIVYFILAFLFVLAMSYPLTADIETSMSIIFVIGSLFILGTFIPSIAVAVRRFHDQNLSGWLYLVSFVPGIGGIILVVFMCIDGTPGPNKYGEDPKGRGAELVFD